MNSCQINVKSASVLTIVIFETSNEAWAKIGERAATSGQRSVSGGERAVAIAGF